MPSLFFAATVAAPAAQPARSENVVNLPDFIVHERRVANDTPEGSFSMPVSRLRYEPLVDLETRNMGEAQGDITIRGGIFENTGFEVGGVTLYDPQTGHYTAEVPIPLEMLRGPQVLTGVANAVEGMNAEVGTVSYDWKPVTTGGTLTAGVGQFGLNQESLYAGDRWNLGNGGEWLGSDFSFARSEGNGSVANGDHHFVRYAGRAQYGTERSQTDIFYGYQSKFFGWPDLYTPFNVPETEDLQTNLFLASYRYTGADNSVWKASLYSRRNRDDYEFDRRVPGEFNPYQHETKTWGASLEGKRAFGDWIVTGRAEAMADSIHSTVLGVHSRSYLKVSLVPERVWTVSDGRRLTVRSGLVFDDTNRDSAALSPVAEVALKEFLANGDSNRWYAQYSQATQVPGYTALYSPPNGGLFRGNPNLGRERSRNFEIGGTFERSSWRIDSAVFYRRDDPLVDWTFSFSSSAARTANPVSIDTTGFQTVVYRHWTSVDLVFGYTWLSKRADYGSASVDASFYALNYARQRVTAAITWRIGDGVVLRMDNEFRVQEKNALRTVGGTEPFLSSLGLYYQIPSIRGLTVSLLVDNLWDSRFQEIPAVPAARRQVSGAVSWQW